MRVLIINSVCGIGSTGRICVDIANMLFEEGHECKIAYGRKKADEKFSNYAVRIGNDLGVRIHGLLSRVFDNTGFYSFFATKKFIKWVKEYDPDVINLHNIHGYYINVKLLFNYLKESGKPIVWTLHDCWAFTGHCSHYTSAKCDKWLTGCYNCSQKKTYPASLVVDNSENNYLKKKSIFTGLKNCTIITVSKWLAKQVKQSYLGCYPIKIIQNGIDLSVFKPTDSAFKKEKNLEIKKLSYR